MDFSIFVPGVVFSIFPFELADKVIDETLGRGGSDRTVVFRGRGLLLTVDDQVSVMETGVSYVKRHYYRRG